MKRCTEKARRTTRVVDVLIVCVFILMSIAAIIGYSRLQGEYIREVEEYGLAGLFVMSMLLEAVPQIIHPFAGVLIAVSVQMKLTSALFVAALGSFIGSVLGFEIGKRYGYRILCAYMRRKPIRRLILLWQRYGYLFVLFAALSPLPYFPIIFGTLGLARKSFFVFGLLPRAASFALFGLLLFYGFGLPF